MLTRNKWATVIGCTGTLLVLALFGVLLATPAAADTASVRVEAAQREQRREMAALVRAAEESAQNSRELVRLTAEVLRELRTHKECAR